MSKETISTFEGWDDTSTEIQASDLGNFPTDDFENKDIEKLQKEGNSEKEKEEEVFEGFEEGDEEDFFGETLENKEQEDEEDNSSITTLKFLRDKGFIEFEEEELEGGKVEDLLEDSWDKAVESALEDSMKDLPQKVKDIVKHAVRGGDVDSLIEKYAAIKETGDDVDSENINSLERIIREEKISEGMDAEEVDEYIDFLKETDKIKNIGKKVFEKRNLRKKEEAEKEKIALKEQQIQRKKQIRDYRDSISTHLGEVEELKGFSFTKEDKKTLPSYVAEPAIELSDGRVVSELQADLFKIMSDKNDLLLLAKLVKSKFDFSSLERNKETQVARNLKRELANDKKNSGVHKKSKKAVWEMFE